MSTKPASKQDLSDSRHPKDPRIIVTGDYKTFIEGGSSAEYRGAIWQRGLDQEKVIYPELKARWENCHRIIKKRDRNDTDCILVLAQAQIGNDETLTLAPPSGIAEPFQTILTDAFNTMSLALKSEIELMAMSLHKMTMGRKILINFSGNLDFPNHKHMKPTLNCTHGDHGAGWCNESGEKLFARERDFFLIGSMFEHFSKSPIEPKAKPKAKPDDEPRISVIAILDRESDQRACLL